MAKTIRDIPFSTNEEFGRATRLKWNREDVRLNGGQAKIVITTFTNDKKIYITTLGFLEEAVEYIKKSKLQLEI